MNQERIDIIDQSGIPLGYSRSRDEVHKTGLWHRTVHVWVINTRNELLLQQRSETKESFPGLWDISAAGHISAGDTSDATACRELEEELGVRASTDELTRLFTITGIYEDPLRPFIDHELTDVYLLKKDIRIGSDTVLSEEVDSVRYFDLNELKRRLAEEPRAFVPHYEAYTRLFGYLAK